LNSEEISNYVDRLEAETNQIKDEALRFSWYMRGGLSYESALMLSFKERELLSKLVKDNMETTKKTGLPYF